jgi:hypothetical protein
MDDRAGAIPWAFATTGAVIHLIQYLINKESTALYHNTFVRSVMVLTVAR